MNTKELKQVIRKFHIGSGSILLVKKGTSMADPMTLRSFEVAVKEMGLHNVLAIVVDDMDDAKIFNNLDMNRLGWYRLSDAQRLVGRIPVMKPQEKGEEVESN